MSSVLLTDYYQYSMAQGYWKLGMHNQEAVFYLFFRRNPLNSDYVIASGLQTVIDFVRDFKFTDADLDYLASLNNHTFSADFLAYLKTLRFTGDIDAVPEGSVVFANEPLLRIKAPLLLAQILETPIINAINFSSTVASLASRMRLIAGDDHLFEFGLRRAQGPNGGLTASRAAFLGGFDATSNVLAGKQFGIPVVGTMSHSWVMAFENELTAFRAYANATRDDLVLLADTYDTVRGIENAITVAHELKKQNRQLKGVRLDSGELAVLSRIAREKLNQAGLHDTQIYVSGDLSEKRLLELKSMHAPINGWGIGTQLSTAYEQPALDMVYKLSAIQKENQWAYKLKRSENSIKTSDPGILQVRRFFQESKWLRDIIYHVDFGVDESHFSPNEKSADLLIPIFKDGKTVSQQPILSESRKYALEQLAQFHASKGGCYSVITDLKLTRLKQCIMESNL